MIIYPEIDLQSGRLVSLVRGNMSEPIVRDLDPVEAAHKLAEDGAKIIQVVDLDAVAHVGNNDAIIEKIIRIGPSVQLGGGINNIETIRRWFDLGLARVVIGTAAVLNPDFLREAVTFFPDQIVLSVDVRENRVLSHGWTQTSVFEPIHFIRQFENLALAGIVVTDVGREAEDPIEAFAMTTEIANAVATPVISSGLVASLDDISTLQYLPNIAGAVTGRALFDRKFTLAEAIEIGNRTEMVPEFT